MKKTILITGASGSLGKACVQKFVTAGYTVAAILSPGKMLGYPVPDTVDTFQADLSDERSSQNAVNAIIQKHKTVDAALLLAGGFTAGSLDVADSSTLGKMFSVNFETAYHAARSIFQHMINQPMGGRIVFIGARPALKAQDGKHAIAYSLSKSLIFKFSELLNAEGAAKNVVSSVVVPSTIDTPPNRESMPKADFSKWVTPGEIADAIAFIVGDEGRSFRGTVLKVYGNA